MANNVGVSTRASKKREMHGESTEGASEGASLGSFGSSPSSGSEQCGESFSSNEDGNADIDVTDQGGKDSDCDSSGSSSKKKDETLHGCCI